MAVKVALLGFALMLLPAGALFAANQNVKPGITLQVSPASQSVERAKNAVYIVSVTSTGGLSGSVSLSANGLPAAASATFSPSSVVLQPGSTASATMTVTTTANTPVGPYSLSVQAVSGKVTGSVAAGLTVNYPLSSSLVLAVTPGSVTVPAGSSGVFTVALDRKNIAGPVDLRVSGGLPAGAVVLFTPNPVTGASTTLKISTDVDAGKGTYTLNLVATGKDDAGRSQIAYASTVLIIDATKKNFTITGTPAGLLAPGVSVPLDLAVSNPDKKSLDLTNLSFSIQSVTRTSEAISRNLPCSRADYTVYQFSGPYPVTVPAGTTSLSSLNVAVAQWPRIGMLDTSANQDGCKGAILQLTYSGSGQGN
ncbi:COG1470 family protein [Paenarthrobacter sp. Z7-10]|uniref:COG1470 family protein n=1 Tax=Paenarthrobacter sp. Z7-10 TaxID=2787635 RepID=UPI0022A9F4AE|nr:hypothetical protein [Paenarthrobacter sp. Z7-10]